MFVVALLQGLLISHVCLSLWKSKEEWECLASVITGFLLFVSFILNVSTFVNNDWRQLQNLAQIPPGHRKVSRLADGFRDHLHEDINALPQDKGDHSK